jgi:type IX secretion system PorP/SprF family membrane protein
MKPILFFVLFTMMTNGMFAQFITPTDLFWNRSVQYNPASIGLDNSLSARLHGRIEMDEIGSDQNSISFNTEKKLERIHGAIGLSYAYDQLGTSRTHEALINYAFHWNIMEDRILSFGLSAGVGQYNFTPYWGLTSPEEFAPEAYSDADFQLDLGIAYHTQKLNIGIGVKDVNRPRYDGKNGVFVEGTPYANLNVDYTFTLSDNIQLTPRFLSQTDLSGLNYQFSVQGTFNQKLWCGFSYSDVQSAGGFIGYDFYEKFRVGYHYSRRLFFDWNGNYHEVTLAFILK